MKTSFLVSMFLVGSLAAWPALAVETTYINATQDAVGDKFESDLYPFNTYLLWVSGTTFFTQQRFGVRFDDLSAIPVSADAISHVWLQLYQFGGLGQGTARIRVSPSEDAWTVEHFPSRGLGVNQNAPFSEAVVTAPGYGGWMSFDVTTIFKDWLLHPEKNQGFSVSAQPANLTNPNAAEYVIAFESTDSARPETSEQFGNNFPPGNPPHLKVQYQRTTKLLPPSTVHFATPTPVPTSKNKQQVKGISTQSKTLWRTLGTFFKDALSFK